MAGLDPQWLALGIPVEKQSPSGDGGLGCLGLVAGVFFIVLVIAIGLIA